LLAKINERRGGLDNKFMFIKSVQIKNYRLFPADKFFKISEINIPDSIKGSGLTIFVGENGTGKTTLLDAFALPLLSYKSESFSVNDLNESSKKTEIIISTEKNFWFDGVMPKTKYKGKGFVFEGSIRSRGNRLYLSSVVVTDRRFIRADGEPKPSDNSPDLRVDVNNPYKGSRFNENDYLYLDRNRLFHVRSGMFNLTRFDKLMEDFNFQYISSVQKNPEDLSIQVLDKVKDKFENQFLFDAIDKFQEITGHNIGLEFLNNWKPFSNAFFATKFQDNLQGNISSLGSGYEMLFCLVYSFYLSRQRGRQLIILIDEPELHMHPKLQKQLVDFLMDVSKESQIILTTQSPLFIKHIISADNVNKVKIFILRRRDVNSRVEVVKIKERVLPFISADEINYIAFELPSIEYHNELYGHLHFINGSQKGIKEFDNDFFVNTYHESKTYPWRGNPNKVSLHTFIRNKIHHPEDNIRVNIQDLKKSIDKMREILLELNHI